MFTGIVKDVGTVVSMARRGDEAILTVKTSLDLTVMAVGDSMAVNGACLTVTTIQGADFTAHVSAETLERTNLGGLKAGDRVNLEPALRLTDFLGGHLVLGHIDGPGRIVGKTQRLSSIVFVFAVGSDLTRYIVEKGSVCVEGVSLTVNRCEGHRFQVNMIPHTAARTTLGAKKIGDVVNIEADIIGKYIERLLTHHAPKGQGIDEKFLADYGFLR
ncbi:MAG: riboflavin synthase [Syntrophales bacterium]|nr:riboflavin synthase [Syntrophales bacterium]